ncbi:MAG: dTMP kinase [Candidatus Marinimicrobia bacterium]|nr:dTMP kinase [Candidatus Neomarinimicrobiota bacterium]
MTDSDKMGLFVTFEGIDGSGKSTQANALLRKVQEEGYNAVLFREPGGTRISEQIRQILLSTKHSEMDSLTEVMLYSAARAQLTVEMILPGLKENDIVICDRYFDSTTAYQGYGRGIDLEFVDALVKEAAKKLWPDVTFLVDVDAELAESRSGTMGRPDRLELETKEFKFRVIKGFKEIAKREPERVIILDGNEKVDAIAEKAWKHISLLLSTKLEAKIKYGQNA